MASKTMWTCCDDEIYDTPGIRKHLADAHGVTGKSIATNQRSVMQLDGEGFALATYEVEIIGHPEIDKLIKTTKIESESTP